MAVRANANLDVQFCGGAAAGEKLYGSTTVDVEATGLSERFGDAMIIASHELHQSHTATSSWTVAAIGLEAGDFADGYHQIRGGTSCVSRVRVLTESQLVEGSLRLFTASDQLRFSTEEGAPWSNAPSFRTDAPPATVAAVRDFWLGAQRGGYYMLSYWLLDPSGMAQLSTNLPIEAIVPRLATNAYYIAHGSTNSILADLSPASHDPAGYTLRLDGTVCAAGPPPWQVPVGHLAPGAHSLTLHSETFPDLADMATVYVVRAALAPDYDRDGVISASDELIAAATNQIFRWWINDDADAEGNFKGDTRIPGRSNGNHADMAVNGRGDLIDFFPVHLDLHEALETLSGVEGVQYRLRHDGGALNAVYTDLTAAGAGAFLTGTNALYGPAFNQPAHAAPVFAVTGGGTLLEAGFLDLIRGDPARGVLLLEGTAATTAPLVIEVWKDDRKIVGAPLALDISGVEQMFRRHNFRIGATLPEILDPQNCPADGTPNMDVFMAHGFLVKENESRAWGAEIFKRLYQEEMNARFHFVT